MCRNIRPLFNFDPPATDDGSPLAGEERWLLLVAGLGRCPYLALEWLAGFPVDEHVVRSPRPTSIC